ncbi:MAG: transmembrane 220 family protein [Cyclobacteriaceae bacterium]|nr:transmembrane 220 family protein [Cyclobacteriaceae bacterium]
MRKIIYFLLTAMFLLFAAVQINDPDPALWILIYGAMVVLCVLGAFKRFQRWPSILLLFLYLLYMGLLLGGFQTWLASENKADLFDDIMKMQHPYIEETREFLGLLINVLVLFGLLIDGARQRAGKS